MFRPFRSHRRGRAVSCRRLFLVYLPSLKFTLRRLAGGTPPREHGTEERQKAGVRKRQAQTPSANPACPMFPAPMKPECSNQLDERIGVSCGVCERHHPTASGTAELLAPRMTFELN